MPLLRLKTLTTDSSVIVAAIQKSKTGLLEISEDKAKIRRFPDKPVPEINDEYRDGIKHRSVYVVSFYYCIPIHQHFNWCIKMLCIIVTTSDIFPTHSEHYCFLYYFNLRYIKKLVALLISFAHTGILVFFPFKLKC